ncbi:MAG: hypothetical protein Kow0090_11050 [Myxococcota bacterium]
MNKRRLIQLISFMTITLSFAFWHSCGGGDKNGGGIVDAGDDDDNVADDDDDKWGTGGKGKIGDRCVQNADCAEGYCSSGVCTPYGGGDGEKCQTSHDCAKTPSTPYCETGSGKCVECITSSHCVTGECISNKCAGEPSDAGDDDDDFVEDVEENDVTTDTGTPTDCNPPCQEPAPYCKNGACKSCLETGCIVGNCNASTGRCTSDEDTGVEDTGDEDIEDIEEPDDSGVIDTGPPDTGPKECDPPCIEPTPICDENGVCVGCATEGCANPNHICNPTTGKCDEKDPEQWDCVYNDDCRTDEFCFLKVKPTNDTPPRFQCQTRRYTLGIGGTPCVAHTDCDSQLCLEREGTTEKYCYGPCKTDDHCDLNFYCDKVTLKTSQNSYEVPGCVINPEDCIYDGDCPGNLICTIGRKKGYEYATVCLERSATGNTEGGLRCLKDSDCIHGKCVIFNTCEGTATPCTSHAQCGPGKSCVPADYCFQPCAEDKHCSAVMATCSGKLEIGYPPSSFQSCYRPGG